MVAGEVDNRMDDEKTTNREELLAAIKAKADAIRAQRATAAQGEQTAQPGAAAQAMETPVSAVNAAGRPVGKPQSLKVRAFGSVTQGVEIVADKSEEDNIKKLLGGLGAYANPLRNGAWQLDYRYYVEARRRLVQAGYEVEETEYGNIALKTWTPHAGGWSRVES